MPQMTPQYRTVLFCDVWDEAADFVSDYKASGLYSNDAKITDTNASILFYHLFAKYGNSPIANSDVNQFKYKVYSIIFQYGPTWEKELDIQKKIRSLSDSDILEGTKSIYNHSFNPSSAPTTSSLTELETINEQNTSAMKRGKLEAYSVVIDLLKSNVTGSFIEKFSSLFKQFVMPEDPLLYITEDEGEDY